VQLSKITECLLQIYRLHAPTNPVYKVFDEIARGVVLSSSLMDGDKANIDLDGYGKVFLPYHNDMMLEVGTTENATCMDSMPWVKP